MSISNHSWRSLSREGIGDFQSSLPYPNLVSMGSLPGCPEPQHWLHPLPFSQHKCWLLLGTSPCSSCTEFFCYQTSWKPGDLQPCYHSNHSITRYVDDSAAKIMFYSRAQAKKKNNQNPLEQHKCSLFSFSTDN